MRREGFELSVSRPRVLFKKGEGDAILEPIEEVVVDVDDAFSGVVVEKLSSRKGEMIEMKPSGGGKTRLVFYVPSRGLIGYQSEFLTDTKGTGVLNRLFHNYAPYKGEYASRINGALISNDTGESVAYAIWGLQDRGIMFIKPQQKVYTGMIVGENSKANDLEVNVLRSDPVTDADIVRLTCERASSGFVPDIRRDLVAYFASNAPSGDLAPVHSSLGRVRKSHIVSGGFAAAFEGSEGISSILLCGSQPVADYAKLSAEIGFAQGDGRFVELSIDSLRFYRLTLAVFTTPSPSLGFLFVPKIQGASINRLGDESGGSMPLSEIFDVESSLRLNPSSRLISVAGYIHPLRVCVLCENSKDTPRYLVVDRDMEDPRIDLIIEKLNSKGASIRKSDVMECSLSDGSVATFIPLDLVTKNLF
jgi:hypothetical protein